MRVGTLYDATVGRSLLTRIWTHGLVLFVGVLGLNFVARFVMPPMGRTGPAILVLHICLLVASALLLAFYFVARPLARAIARPLLELGALARELGAGNLAVRAPDGRRDEIGDLARSFNRMASHIQRLRSAERELLTDVSHELRTPLARMRVVLDLASDAEAKAETSRDYLREITTDLAELEQLLDDIIVSSRLDPEAAHWAEAQPPLRRRPLEVADLVEATALRFRARWPERALDCRVPEERLVMAADPVLLRRALDNLVDNARKYSPKDRPIVVDVAVPSAATTVMISVIDDGAGIAAEDEARLFTPFFRADRSRSRATGGVGLGLTLARRIAVAHGGTIGYQRNRERGSRFWLSLPLEAA